MTLFLFHNIYLGCFYLREEKMKYILSLLFLFMSYQLGAMQQEVIAGPHKGTKVLIQASKDTTDVLKNIMFPSETNYICGLSYQIKADKEYQPAFVNAMAGNSEALMKILEKHNYTGTVHYAEIDGLMTCIHHTWLKKGKEK